MSEPTSGTSEQRTPPTSGGKPRPWSLVFVALLAVGVVGGFVVVNQIGGGNGSYQRSPVTVSGDGIMDSKEVRLAGDYSVSWTATPHGDTDCYQAAHLDSHEVRVSATEYLGHALLDDGQPKTSTTNLYDLDDAWYYVDATSGCSWQYTFTPR